jgi:tetratricopeptide (TPR) repeat protein
MDTVDSLRRAAEQAPADAEAWAALAAAFSDREEPDEAERHCRLAIARAPDTPRYYALLGRALSDAQRWDEAAAALRQAVALDPHGCAWHEQLGEILYRADRPAEALEAFVAAVPFVPDDLKRRADLARSLFNCAFGVGARTPDDPSMDRARSLAATLLDPCLQGVVLAGAAQRYGAYDVARRACEQALVHNPRSALALNALAQVVRTVDRDMTRATHLHAQAVEADPDDPLIRGDHLVHLLWQGDYEQASSAGRYPRLVEYLHTHWRRDTHLHSWRPLAYTRPWMADPLQGMTIMLHALSGYGDTIQFARFAVPLRALGARVIIKTRRRMVDLIRTADGVHDAVAPFDDHPVADWDCDIVWVWLGLQPRLDTVAAPGAYLHPPASLCSAWRDRLAVPGGLRVGLVWSGSPANRHNPAAHRAIPFEMLRPVWSIPGVQCYGLQRGPAAAQLYDAPGSHGVIDIEHECGNFLESAAAISALDVVVSVDTSIAHLAGALGKPVLLLLPTIVDVRWMMDRLDSPWYPTMRLFRQSRPGQWEPVIDAVAQALRVMTLQASPDRRPADTAVPHV